MTRQFFPSTEVSTIRDAAAASDSPRRVRAFATLSRVYWRPMYVYTRMKWRMSVHEAEDLTQEFFATAFAKRYFDGYLPSRGRFRTFLRVCLDRFVAKHIQAQGRLKRRWDRLALAIPVDEAEQAVAAAAAESDLETVFDVEWTRALLAVSLESLRSDCVARGKTLGLALFERLLATEGEPPSYAELARDHGVTVTDVTNHLARTRRRFRSIVLDKLREVTADEDEFRNEARAVLGIELARAS